MTELARRRAFLGAAAMVGAAALVPVLSSSPSTGGGKPAARDRPMVLAAANAPSSGSPRRRGGANSRTGERDPKAPARQRALAFVRAFLHYQVGDTGPRTRAALARTASTALARYLATSRTRTVGAARHAELLSLHLYVRGGSKVKASALLRYRRRRSLFEFRLRRGGDGWRVAEIYR
jgi:hypothetical protein